MSPSLAVALALAVSLLHLAAAATYLDFARGQNAGTSNDPNFVRLTCLDPATHLGFRNAVFFLNETLIYDLRDPQRVDSEDRPVDTVYGNARDGEIFFVINRRAEGDYRCGVLTTDGRSFFLSNFRTLVALPPATPTPDPPNPLVNAKINSEARIECPNPPGALVQWYYITWRNSSSNQILANVPESPLAEPVRSDPRYRIDNTTFALLISNANLLDSGAFYSCELGVVDPQLPSTRHTYDPSASVELLVYEPSAIITGPTSLVRSANATPNTATFRCSAEGSSTPIIVWRLGGVNITSGNSKYIVSQVESMTASGRSRVDGTLVVLDLNGHDTAVVECLADTPPSPATNGQRLPGDMASAELTVLDVFDELNVFITTKNDVIFFLTYPTPPLHPVRLRLLYREAGRGNRSLLVTPRDSFVGSREINYIAFSSTVPYDRFRVEVSLVHESVEGPGRDTMLVYNKQIPSETAEIIRNAILPAFLPALFLLGVFITSVLLVAFCCCRRIRKEAKEARLREDRLNANIEAAERRNEDISKTLDNLNRLVGTQSVSSENVEKLLQAILKIMDQDPWHVGSDGELCHGQVCGSQLSAPRNRVEADDSGKSSLSSSVNLHEPIPLHPMQHSPTSCTDCCEEGMSTFAKVTVRLMSLAKTTESQDRGNQLWSRLREHVMAEEKGGPTWCDVIKGCENS